MYEDDDYDSRIDLVNLDDMMSGPDDSNPTSFPSFEEDESSDTEVNDECLIEPIECLFEGTGS